VRQHAPSASVTPIRRPASRTNAGAQHLHYSSDMNNSRISNASTSSTQTLRRQRYAALSPTPPAEVRGPLGHAGYYASSSSESRRLSLVAQRLKATERRVNAVTETVDEVVRRNIIDMQDPCYQGSNHPLLGLEERQRRDARALRRGTT
jgi:hypothetical protein